MRLAVERQPSISSAECLDCPWVWTPREGTPTTGAQGGRSAFAAARMHGKSRQHKVAVTREAQYDYRAAVDGGTTP